MMLGSNLNVARSQPENIIKMIVSLIVDMIDPPRRKGKHLVMSPTLEKALSEIEKGAEERLEVLRSQKKQVEEGEASTETVPRLVGHIEKVEPEEFEEQPEDDRPVAENEVSGRLTADWEATAVGEKGGEQATGEDIEQVDEVAKPTDKDEMAEPMDKDDKVTGSAKRKTRSTPSVTRMKDECRRARAKEQERRWIEATDKGLGEAPTGEIDLEDAMLSPEESEKQQAGEKEKADEEEGYSKVYTKTHEKCAERSLLRAEKRKQDEKCKRQEAALKAAQEVKDRMAQDEAKQIIERAQLEEEELAVQKWLERKRKLQEMAEEKKKDSGATGETGSVKISATSKQQWKEHLGLKVRKRRCEGEAEEEYCEVDDEDKDPDYQPDKDPEQDFIVEDTELDKEETFEIEKHVHAINLQEAGDYVVEIRWFVECFGKVVRKAKRDVAREYRKLIHFMCEMVLKIEAYGLVEHTDEEAVYKTIVDPTCTAWRQAMHGAKTGNSKDIQRIEEKRQKVQKLVEECEILRKEEMMDIAGPMEECTPEHKKHVRNLIKHYWAHTAKADKEASAAASILRLLADEVDKKTYMVLLNAGT